MLMLVSEEEAMEMSLTVVQPLSSRDLRRGHRETSCSTPVPVRRRHREMLSCTGGRTGSERLIGDALARRTLSRPLQCWASAAMEVSVRRLHQLRSTLVRVVQRHVICTMPSSLILLL